MQNQKPDFKPLPRWVFEDFTRLYGRATDFWRGLYGYESLSELLKVLGCPKHWKLFKNQVKILFFFQYISKGTSLLHYKDFPECHRSALAGLISDFGRQVAVELRNMAPTFEKIGKWLMEKDTWGIADRYIVTDLRKDLQNCIDRNRQIR